MIKKIIVHILIAAWVVLMSSAVGLYWKYNTDIVMQQHQVLLDYIIKESNELVATLKNRAEVEERHELMLKHQEVILEKLNSIIKK